jgi:hypothetical protein
MTEYISILNPSIRLDSEGQRQLLFEQYKLFVSSADKIITARKETNTLYITLNSVIISTVGAIGEGKIFPDNNLLLVATLMIIGIGSVISWISTLSLYQTVDYENYSIIKELEAYFPSSIYTRFNQHIAKENISNNDKSFFVKKERLIPYSFLVGYSLFVISDLYKMYIKAL